MGSNLVDVLMKQGHIVYVMDNLFTGKRKNIEHWIGAWCAPRFMVAASAVARRIAAAASCFLSRRPHARLDR